MLGNDVYILHFFVTINWNKIRVLYISTLQVQELLQTNKSLTEEKIVSLSFRILFVLYDQDYDHDHYFFQHYHNLTMNFMFPVPEASVPAKDICNFQVKKEKQKHNNEIKVLIMILDTIQP